MQHQLINKERERFELEFKMKHKEGHWVDILSRARAIFDENGTAIRIVGTHVDISERKKMEEERDEARQLFQKIFELSPVATTLASIADRKIVDVNEATAHLLECTREDLVDKWSPSVDYWANPAERQEAFETLLKDGRITNYEFTFKTQTGKLGRALIFAEIIHQSENSYVLTVYIDITERLRIQAELEQHREHLEEMVNKRTENLNFLVKAMAGREVRMAELKKVIKQLRRQIKEAGMTPVANDPLLGTNDT